MTKVEHKLTVLSQIAKELNQRNITWAVGASLLLYFKGIVPDFNDIDIMVVEDEIDEVKEIFLSYGILQAPNPNVTYRTRHFLEFLVEDIEIDVMAGFVIMSNNTEHNFPLKAENIKEFAQVKGVTIPLQSVEEWRRYYQLMGRDERVKLIEVWQQKK